METKTYTTLDKSEWQRGPWDSEPDKVQWQDEATGLPCLAHRGPGGHWCGYVGVSEGHPFFEKEYDDCPVEVHGGLTFSDHCQETESECSGICHKPGEGETDNVWWLGFDCAYYADLSPAYQTLRIDLGFARHDHRTYRSLSYVQDECRSLAKQLNIPQGQKAA